MLTKVPYKLPKDGNNQQFYSAMKSMIHNKYHHDAVVPRVCMYMQIKTHNFLIGLKSASTRELGLVMETYPTTHNF